MEGSEASLRAWIQQATEGNAGAFSQLVRLFRPQVLRVAYGVVGSSCEAEDVAQDVFVKVWQRLGAQETEGAFASWLYRITVNTAIDAVRRRRQESPLDDRHADAGAWPEQTVLQHYERDQVRDAVAALPDSARAALILREYEQLSYQEIAQVLDIPIGTVMSRLSYARQVLRKRLAKG
jgi:RNA polymerase sigma-70 factor (ECF subfamily)